MPTRHATPAVASSLPALIAALALPLLAACAQLPAAGGPGAAAGGTPAARQLRLRGPESLVGLDRVQLAQQLGQPDYRRMEDTVLVWQYRLDNCVVDFVFHQSGGGYHIAAWNGRHRTSGVDYNHDTCRRELRRHKAQRG